MPGNTKKSRKSRKSRKSARATTAASSRAKEAGSLRGDAWSDPRVREEVGDILATTLTHALLAAALSGPEGARNALEVVRSLRELIEEKKAEMAEAAEAGDDGGSSRHVIDPGERIARREARDTRRRERAEEAILRDPVRAKAFLEERAERSRRAWLAERFRFTPSPEGEDLSPEEKCARLLKEWDARRLSPSLPLLFVTDFPLFVEEDRTRRVVTVVFGFDMSGRRELVHVEAGTPARDAGWERLSAALRERGVRELSVLFDNGMDVSPAGVRAVFPDARVFRCLQPLVEKSCRLVPHGMKGQWRPALKTFLESAAPAAGLERLSALWGETAPDAVEVWQRHLKDVEAVLVLPPAVRSVAIRKDPLKILLPDAYRPDVVSPLDSVPVLSLLIPCVLLACREALPFTRRMRMPYWSKLCASLETFPRFRELRDRSR